jgi:hypothetical protein
MYVCMYVCIYIYIYININTQTHTHTRIHTIHTYMHTHTHTHTHTHLNNGVPFLQLSIRRTSFDHSSHEYRPAPRKLKIVFDVCKVLIYGIFVRIQTSVMYVCESVGLVCVQIYRHRNTSPYMNKTSIKHPEVPTHTFIKHTHT